MTGTKKCANFGGNWDSPPKEKNCGDYKYDTTFIRCFLVLTCSPLTFQLWTCFVVPSLPIAATIATGLVLYTLAIYK